MLNFEPSTAAVGMFVGQKIYHICTTHTPYDMRRKLHPKQTLKWIKNNKHVLFDVISDEFAEPLVLGYFNHAPPVLSVFLYAILFLFIWMA